VSVFAEKWRPELVTLKDEKRKTSAAERVLDHILDELDSGRLAPGRRINAAKIASNLSLSAAPVREALSVLAGRGVLELLPDRGAVMKPFTADEVCKLFDVVARVGGLGLQLAGQAIADGADASSLEERYSMISDAFESAAPVQLMLRFNEWHFAVNSLGGNEFINLTFDRLGLPYWNRFLAALIDVDAHREAYRDNYKRMHDALMAGDGRTAEAALAFHAEWSNRLVRANVAQASSRKRGRRPRGASFSPK
jgi:DNA-binding GntR family transcriptional regulator